MVQIVRWYIINQFQSNTNSICRWSLPNARYDSNPPKIAEQCHAAALN
jgi:hypothetical protein